MKEMPSPEQFHLPDTQLRVAELRGEMQELEEKLVDATAFLARAHDRHLQETEYLKEVEERLARAESGEDAIQSPEELRILQEETLAYVGAAKLNIESYVRVMNDFAEFRRRLETEIAARFEKDRLAGRLGNPARPPNKA